MMCNPEEQLNESLQQLKEILKSESKVIIEYINNEISSKVENEFNGKIFELGVNIKNCRNYNVKSINKISDNAKEENYAGIYIFILKEDINNIDVDTFNRVKYSAKINGNNNYFKKNKVLYIGKSEHVISRIRQHCYLSGESKTYSLKLNDANIVDHFKEDSITIYTFKLMNHKEYYSLICLTIEKILHENYKPLIGTSR